MIAKFQGGHGSVPNGVLRINSSTLNDENTRVIVLTVWGQQRTIMRLMGFKLKVDGQKLALKGLQVILRLLLSVDKGNVRTRCKLQS